MEIAWPALPEVFKDDPQVGVKTSLYQAQLDVLKFDHQAALANSKAEFDAVLESAKRDAVANIEREKADWANEYAQAQAVNSAYLDVAKASLERATARANFVQGAATAISGAYVGILALSFTVAQNKPLPPRGIYPTVFFGLAIFLAAAYTAFLTKPQDVALLPSSGNLRDDQRQRRNSFVLWTRASSLRRRHFLQASVISLGIGALLLPLPFVEISNNWGLILLGLGLLCVALLPATISRWLGESA
jgi:hypothetical protein